jgi:nitrate reductase cytochrome c-type subunit
MPVTSHFRKLISKKSLLFSVVLLLPFGVLLGEEKPEHEIDEDSKKCLECHSGLRYHLYDPETDETVSLKMYEELRIDKDLYKKAAHGGFACTDCHSLDYETHPHPISVKFEFQYSCIDCHGGDDDYAHFNFETIEEEFNSSVHGDHYIENFSCWSCHNPHTYKVAAREGGRVIDIVAYDNSMCLGCHGDISHYEVLIERQLTNMLSKHDWLPNQSLHFRKVRCIDCHAATHDDLLVAHHVLPADQAVKNCVDCHSTNSILMASLYKHQIVERRNKYGFFNAEITSDAYIIGANRNYFFNIASIVIFGLTLIGIAIHATLRYINYKRKK